MTTIAKRQRLKEIEAEATQLRKEIEQAEVSCQHEWGQNVVFDPVKTKDAVYSHLEGRGSDPVAQYTYVDRDIPRWRRDCVRCGASDYATVLKPVLMTPDFGA